MHIDTNSKRKNFYNFVTLNSKYLLNLYSKYSQELVINSGYMFEIQVYK